MTKKKPTKTEIESLDDFITMHLRNILWCGNLSNFELRILYAIEKPKTKKKITSMEIEVDHTYLEFDLGYNEEQILRYWQGKRYTKIIKILCHELTHIITNEADDMLKFKSNRKEIEYYFERMTEHTSRWLFRIYEDFMENRKVDIKTGLIKK